MRFILAVAALSLATPVWAEDPVPAAAAKPAKPKKICKAVEPSSTSRIGAGRVCKTAEQWASDGASSTGSARAMRSVTPD